MARSKSKALAPGAEPSVKESAESSPPEKMDPRRATAVGIYLVSLTTLCGGCLVAI